MGRIQTRFFPVKILNDFFLSTQKKCQLNLVVALEIMKTKRTQKCTSKASKKKKTHSVSCNDETHETARDAPDWGRPWTVSSTRVLQRRGSPERWSVSCTHASMTHVQPILAEAPVKRKDRETRTFKPASLPVRNSMNHSIHNSN